MGIQTDGPLFEAVQRARLFPDSKAFVDALPVVRPQIISARFSALGSDPSADELRTLVHSCFSFRPAPNMERSAAASADEFVSSQWKSLVRVHETTDGDSTLIALPHPYVVPGGRFDELFYWDSYFTGLGMLRHGHVELFKGMVDNLVDLQERFGHIPNGSRTYLVTRSQPPLLAAMVRALGTAGFGTAPYLPALLREHTYWTSDGRIATEIDGVKLSRYWDELETPRPEAFVEDLDTARGSEDPSEVYRNLRAGAASGWDFSSRWCRVPHDLTTIATTDVVPVDLNALLVQLERTIASVLTATGDAPSAARWEHAGLERAAVIRDRFWDPDVSWFCDLDRLSGERRTSLSLAGMVPLAVGIATHDQALLAKATLIDRFLAPGGLRSTLVESGQQWDAPNGWAPLHWWAVTGLRAYGFVEQANLIADRWLATCRAGFLADGTLLEKYDVEVRGRRAGGGEYEVQEGFGWTNGVLADLAADP